MKKSNSTQPEESKNKPNFGKDNREGTSDKQKTMMSSQVLNTDGGEMPDPSLHKGASEKDVRFAFKKDKPAQAER